MDWPSKIERRKEGRAMYRTHTALASSRADG
jgi:hypothetical protein